MTLRCVVASDDDIDKAGNLLADADFWDGDDGEVDAIDGMNPTLTNIIVWENSTIAKNTSWRARGAFQMNTWPNTRRINVLAARMGGIATDSADATHTSVGSMHNTLEVGAPFNIPLQAGDDWVSDNSYLYSSVDNAPVLGCMFCYSYGTRYPFRGGHVQWIRKVADAAEGGADAFYQAWASDLTGVAPGLDPHKSYVLRGVVHEAAATAKAGIGAFAMPQASAYKLFGPAWSDFGLNMTIFLDDGIPVNGQDGFVAKTGSAGAADTPYVWLGFEEYGGTAQASSRAITPPTLSRPGSVSGPVAGLGGVQRQGGFGGLFGLGR